MNRPFIISHCIVRCIICIGLSLTMHPLFAQEDSVRFSRDSVRTAFEFNKSLPVISSALSPEESVPFSALREQPFVLPAFSLEESLYFPYFINPSPLFRGDYNTSGVLRQFSHGVLSASGGQSSLPGIGRFNDASLSYQRVINCNLAFQVGVDALKINMSHITGQTFSVSGALLYRTSDRLAFKVFGSYAIGNTYGMNTHNYGASMSLKMSDRFEMEVGVQRYYNFMRGCWETVPMVVPTYSFDKFKLGLDVGGLLYEVLRNVAFPDKRNSGGPTIAPPRSPMR